MKIPAVVAACLLVAAFSAQAAQKPAKKPAPAQVAPQDIDVDALARAKDVGATPTANAAPATDEPATSEATSNEAAKPSADAPATDAAQAEAAPAADEPAASDAAAPAEKTAAAAEVPTDAAAGQPRPAPLAPPTQADQSLAAGCESRATALLDAAQKGDFAAATHDFDANMRSALTPEKFRQAWDSLAQFGALQERGQSHAAQSDGYVAITIPLIFEKQNLYAQVACGSDGRVAGFYIKPIETPAQ